MKRFDQLISPMSWLVVYLGFLPLILAIFRPTPLELGVFFGVDLLALAVMRQIDARLFLLFYPDSTGFFPDGATEPAGLSEVENGLRLFDALVRFPRRRALYVIETSVLKAIPAILVIVFYWHHEGTVWVQLCKIFTLIALIWSYFYVAVYIESHRLISAKIAEYHQRHNWKRVFEQARFPYSRRDFKVQESIFLLSICGFAISLHWLVGEDRTLATVGGISLPSSLITFASIGLITRIWYLEKVYFIGGIESLFRSMENLDPGDVERVLPLRSTPLLAKFGQTFNALEGKIAAYKRELAAMAQIQAEESRYQAIGELSALTLHDISAPLQVIQFLTEQIGESPDCVKDPEYVRQLTENVQKSVALLQSLRTHLRESTSSHPIADFRVSSEHAFQLLEAFFQGKAFHKVRWEVDERLSSLQLQLQLQITNADLIHVLFNLLKNSMQNLLGHPAPDPRVAMSLVKVDADQAVIAIEDNGTGLSPDRYQELTTLSGAGRRPLRESMGLRLTRRVVERNGGQLVVLPAEKGTVFHLALPLGDPQAIKETGSRYAATPAADATGWSRPKRDD